MKRPEALDFPGARVTHNCEPPGMSAGNRVVCIFNWQAHSVMVLWDQHFDTNESVREMSPVGGPKLRQLQFVFLFCTLKPQGEADKRVSFQKHTGSRQVVKGNGPLFQLFLWVILFQVASEVILGK